MSAIPTISPEKRSEIKRLLKAGFLLSEVRDQVRVTMNTVSSIAYDMRCDGEIPWPESVTHVESWPRELRYPKGDAYFLRQCPHNAFADDRRENRQCGVMPQRPDIYTAGGVARYG